jgi:sugar lactone lactonase YvrE
VTAVVQITRPIAHHGEGPLWDHGTNRLLLLDMLAGAVISLDGDGSATRHMVGTIAATVRARSAGGYVLALERGFAVASADFAKVEPLAEVFSDPDIRMNDGGCDPQGRFYCGTMAYDMRPGAGTLYRLDPDRRIATILTGVTISNGIQWSSDGATVYYSDTGEGRVDVFDFDPARGAFAGRRPFVSIEEALGAPDGLAIDSEGGLWVALWGGAQVHRYDQQGVLTEVLNLPVTNVTACTFGGADGSTLFITTSRLEIDPDQQPGAGAVFAAEVGVTGGVQHAFAG